MYFWFNRLQSRVKGTTPNMLPLSKIPSNAWKYGQFAYSPSFLSSQFARPVFACLSNSLFNSITSPIRIIPKASFHSSSTLKCGTSTAMATDGPAPSSRAPQRQNFKAQESFEENDEQYDILSYGKKSSGNYFGDSKTKPRYGGGGYTADKGLPPATGSNYGSGNYSAPKYQNYEGSYGGGGGSRDRHGGRQSRNGGSRDSYGGRAGYGGGDGGRDSGYGSRPSRYNGGNRDGYGNGVSRQSFGGEGLQGEADPYGRGQLGMGSLLSKIPQRTIDTTALPPIVKSWYEAPVTPMTAEAVSSWRQSHGLHVIGGGNEVPEPAQSFTDVGFEGATVQRLQSTFSAPSPIQSQGWTIAASGVDMVATAETGSGKTLAFILPALEHIKRQARPAKQYGASSPLAVVLTPTRELSMQIAEEARKFSGIYGVNVACVYGGADTKYEQKRQLAQNPMLIIATPGRLIDYVSNGLIDVTRTSYVVLDEADRMLDMGFEEQVHAICGQMRSDRQMLMWSATWPRQIQNLANSYMVNPVRIRVGSDELTANKLVTQEFIFCEKRDRLFHLINLLNAHKGVKILVFVSTKSNAELVADELYNAGHKVHALHGDKVQSARNHIMADFKTGRAPVLIATDVASRGIDVSDIKIVINYELPSAIDAYVHRIGRTGRAGKHGNAISIITNDDTSLLPQIERILNDAGQKPTDEFMNAIKATRTHGPGARRGTNTSRSFRRY